MDDVQYWTATEARKLIAGMTGVRYSVSSAYKLLKRWQYRLKVSVRRYVRRPSDGEIIGFQRELAGLIPQKIEEGYAIAVQDETIVTADARPPVKGPMSGGAGRESPKQAEHADEFFQTRTHPPVVTAGAVKMLQTLAGAKQKSTQVPHPAKVGGLLAVGHKADRSTPSLPQDRRQLWLPAVSGLDSAEYRALPGGRRCLLDHSLGAQVETDRCRAGLSGPAPAIAVAVLVDGAPIAAR